MNTSFHKPAFESLIRLRRTGNRQDYFYQSSNLQKNVCSRFAIAIRTKRQWQAQRIRPRIRGDWPKLALGGPGAPVLFSQEVIPDLFSDHSPSTRKHIYIQFEYLLFDVPSGC
jgi:hypothetical protein